MEAVRVGVVGTGTMGRRHCRIYSDLHRARLCGVVDAIPATAAQVAKQYDVPLYGNLDDLLKEVDAVSLAVPTQLHFELAMHCLARGVHVLIEKPITETLAQAELLTRTAEASGLVVQVGHIERFNPTYTELKNVLADMSLLAVNFRRLSPFQGSNTDVDVISDLMIHDIDLLLDLMGREPALINAYGLTALSGTIDHVVAHLGPETGPLVSITASRVTEQKVRSIEATAMEAYVVGDLLNKAISVHRHTTGEYQRVNHAGIKYRQESIVECIHVPALEPLFLELQHFVECVLHGKPPLVSARDGLRALRLATLIRTAVRGHLVDLSHGLEPRQLVGVGPVTVHAEASAG